MYERPLTLDIQEKCLVITLKNGKNVMHILYSYILKCMPIQPKETVIGIKIIYVKRKNVLKSNKISQHVFNPSYYHLEIKTIDLILNNPNISNVFDIINKINKYIEKGRNGLRFPPRLFFIINPVGGRKKGYKIYNKICKPFLKLLDLSSDILITEHAGHAFNYIVNKEIKFCKEMQLIVIGGDGTLNEIVKAFMHLKQDAKFDSSVPVIGLIPSGSTNATAFSLYGCDDPLTALCHCLLGRTLPFDVGVTESLLQHTYDPVLRNCITKQEEVTCKAFNYTKTWYSLSLLSYGFFGDVLTRFDESTSFDSNTCKIFDKNTAENPEQLNIPKFNEALNVANNGITNYNNMKTWWKKKMLKIIQGPIKYDLAAASIIVCREMAYPATVFFESQNETNYQEYSNSNMETTFEKCSLDQVTTLSETGCHSEKELITSQTNDISRTTKKATKSKAKLSYRNTLHQHESVEKMCFHPCSQCNLFKQTDEKNGFEEKNEFPPKNCHVVSGHFDAIIVMPISGRCSRTRCGVSPFAHISDGLCDLIFVRPEYDNCQFTKKQRYTSKQSDKTENFDDNSPGKANPTKENLPQKESLNNIFHDCFCCRCQLRHIKSRYHFLRYVLRVVHHQNNPFDLPFVTVYRVNQFIFLPFLLNNKVIPSIKPELPYLPYDDLSLPNFTFALPISFATFCDCIKHILNNSDNLNDINNLTSELSQSSNIYISPDLTMNKQSKISNQDNNDNNKVPYLTIDLIQILESVKLAWKNFRVETKSNKANHISTWNCDGEILKCPFIYHRIMRGNIQFLALGPQLPYPPSN